MSRTSVGEARLVVDGAGEARQVLAGALLDPVAPQLDDLAARLRAAALPVSRSRTISATASSSGASARSVISW